MSMADSVDGIKSVANLRDAGKTVNDFLGRRSVSLGGGLLPPSQIKVLTPMRPTPDSSRKGCCTDRRGPVSCYRPSSCGGRLSDLSDDATAEDEEKLRADLGIRTILDLRTKCEASLVSLCLRKRINRPD